MFDAVVEKSRVHAQVAAHHAVRRIAARPPTRGGRQARAATRVVDQAHQGARQRTIVVGIHKQGGTAPQLPQAGKVAKDQGATAHRGLQRRQTERLVPGRMGEHGRPPQPRGDRRGRHTADMAGVARRAVRAVGGPGVPGKHNRPVEPRRDPVQGAGVLALVPQAADPQHDWLLVGQRPEAQRIAAVVDHRARQRGAIERPEGVQHRRGGGDEAIGQTESVAHAGGVVGTGGRGVLPVHRPPPGQNAGVGNAHHGRAERQGGGGITVDVHDVRLQPPFQVEQPVACRRESVRRHLRHPFQRERPLVEE